MSGPFGSTTSSKILSRRKSFAGTRYVYTTNFFAFTFFQFLLHQQSHFPVECIVFFGAIKCNKTNGVFYFEKYRGHGYGFRHQIYKSNSLMAFEMVEGFFTIRHRYMDLQAVEPNWLINSV